MATLPAHFGFIAEQLRLLRDWEPRISDEQLAEGAEAMVDSALFVYRTLEQIERAWPAKVESGEWGWNDGRGNDLAEMYRDWHRVTARVLNHLEGLSALHISMKNAEALREGYAKVSALMDIGMDRVFQQPAPPQSGKTLREVRNELQR